MTDYIFWDIFDGINILYKPVLNLTHVSFTGMWLWSSVRYTSLNWAMWSLGTTISIENTRWVYFDIKFTREGFENACWHREACRAIQHAFSKPSLVNLISKKADLVFYLSAYALLNTLKTSDYDVFFLFLCWFSVISDVIQKTQRHHDLIKVTCREIGNVY